MDKKELRQLSKRELLLLIAEQQEQRITFLEEENRSLKERISELEHLLKAYDNPHTPSSKQRKRNTSPDPNKPRFPGKPPGSAGGGVELPPPDTTEEHTLKDCPECHGTLQQQGKRTQRVIDFLEKPLLVTEHQMHRYFCAHCDLLVEAGGPRDVYGPHLRSAIAMLRNLTLSNQKVADYFRELGAPSLSAAQVQHIVDEFAHKLEPTRNNILEEIRRSPYVHADETGLRKDGKNGYVWGVFTPLFSLLSAVRSRAAENVKTLLEGFKGVLISDGYAAYAGFKLHQRCWAHLIREFKDYAERNPEIEVQYRRVKAVYERMKGMLEKRPDENTITKIKTEFQDIITCLNAIRQGRKLATYLQNGGDDWFTALSYSGVPLENNCAERGLRHIVLHRKMMGCYRNDKGKRFIENVVSVIQSWKLQGKSVFQQLCMVAGHT